VNLVVADRQRAGDTSLDCGSLSLGSASKDIRVLDFKHVPSSSLASNALRGPYLFHPFIIWNMHEHAQHDTTQIPSRAANLVGIF
jgi:hypothetical protein